MGNRSFFVLNVYQVKKKNKGQKKMNSALLAIWRVPRRENGPGNGLNVLSVTPGPTCTCTTVNVLKLRF